VPLRVAAAVRPYDSGLRSREVIMRCSPASSATSVSRSANKPARALPLSFSMLMTGVNMMSGQV
jgi:hypothetical protein